MKTILRRGCAFLLALLLLPSFPCPAEELSVGDKGERVVEVKERLCKLGYMKKSTFSSAYTEVTAEKVSAFQETNGLSVTGSLDEEALQLLFSNEALPAPRPSLPPLNGENSASLPQMPSRDGEGYLAGEGEYIYEDEENGLWIYLNGKLQVWIRHFRDESVPLEWFETEILCRDGEAFRTVQTDPEHPGRGYRYPFDIAAENRFVLGFSDDFFAVRMAQREKPGVILREGVILSEKTKSKRGHATPNLDMMAQFPDGTLRVYECGELTAAELKEMGAVNVFSFGPILLRDGRVEPLLYDYYKSTEPRQALGMISPGHYLLVSVQGRTQTSPGTSLQRVAELMLSRGVTDALALDGGNTMALVFRGKMLNKMATFKKKKFIRTVTSLIGIGDTDPAEE